MPTYSEFIVQARIAFMAAGAKLIQDEAGAQGSCVIDRPAEDRVRICYAGTDAEGHDLRMTIEVRDCGPVISAKPTLFCDIRRAGEHVSRLRCPTDLSVRNLLEVFRMEFYQTGNPDTRTSHH